MRGNVPLFAQNKDKDEEHDVSAVQRCGNIGLFFLWGGGTVSDISCAVSCQHGMLLVMETHPSFFLDGTDASTDHLPQTGMATP
jgi:hypothetical protein